MSSARHLFYKIPLGISLFLLLVSVALWVRTARVGRSIERVDPTCRIVITSMGGLISVTRWDGPFEPEVEGAVGPNFAPRRVWQRWAYWRGWDGVERDPEAWAYYPIGGGSRWWQSLGFDLFDKQITPSPSGMALHDWLQPTWSGRERNLLLPYWALVLLFAGLPTIWLSKWVLRRRCSIAGLCPSCGYDLRASPEICPECGNKVSAS